MARFTCMLAFLLVSVSFPSHAGELVRIPASRQMMTEALSGVPVEVTTSEFLLGDAELTQAEFERAMGYNPSFHKGPDLPVENVSWWEAIACCNRLSEMEGLEPCYDLSTGECDYSRRGYRLPTEAEWELADSLLVKPPAEEIARAGNIGSANNESLEQLDRELRERGTRRVRSYEPNYFGIHDMVGNVWEWCSDCFDPERDTPTPLHNPVATTWSPMRILRGGSFISLAGNWARGYRSGKNPDYRSRFTGFRVCRSLERGMPERETGSEGWFEPYNRVPESFRGRTGELPPLDAASTGRWQSERPGIEAKWFGLLGWEHRPGMPGEPSSRLIRRFEQEHYTGELRWLRVEPDREEKIYLMIPRRPVRQPAPVVIVPYYDVDTPAALNMGGRNWRPHSVRSFAWLAVQMGYVACAVRWFGESYGESYGEAVANLHLRHPGLSGLGKWVWDSKRLLDYLGTLPFVDSGSIGMIGHSLGGKMTLYATAFDSRIGAAVSSEPGIGLTFSNYEDYWYLSREIKGIEKHTDHNELLALIAPRAFMLIGGDSADNDRSWLYINSARRVYGLLGASRNIGYFNHRTGHSPTPESVHLALRWLAHFLDGS